MERMAPLQIPGKTFEYLAAGRRILAFTELEGATGEMLRRVPGCLFAQSSDEAKTGLEGFWRQWQEGEDPFVDHASLLDELSYARRAKDLALLLRRFARADGRPQGRIRPST
jgi:hypothetical protein